MKKFLITCFTIGIFLSLVSDAKSVVPPTIAVIDTGVDMSNKVMTNKIVGEACILVQNTCPNGKNFMEGTGSATLDPVKAPIAMYHGTAMAGIIVDNSNANIVFIRIIGMNPDGSRAVANVSVLERAFQWILDNQTKYNISEVSISQTIRNTSTCLSNKIVESNVTILKNAGVPVFSASGNESDYSHINFPACIPDVIAIGATDPATVKGEFPALYSNLSDDFYTLGTMSTYTSATTKAKTVGTSNSTALFASRWFNMDNSLSYSQKYAKIKSLAKVVSTAKVSNVLVVNQ
jgi:hypothetical protein